MNQSMTYKILRNNLVQGEVKPGNEITVKVNQTLTQDSTGTMVYLQLEAMGITERKTDLSVAYIDHNTLQTGFENADDHAFIKSAAEKYGIIFSKAGNGICHQLHLERFGKPTSILLGSDSHTPTGGGLGTLSIGAGGLDIAIAIATGKYNMAVPKVMNVHLTGKLSPKVSAKDVILYILKVLTVKGGVGYVMEYTGPGVSQLSVTDRATITNMGAELGATSSIFPSDDLTKDFLKRQNREGDFEILMPDEDAYYDKVIVIDLSEITPMIALPHSPDNVKTVAEVAGKKVDQIAIGSCTNSSYRDLMIVANILNGKSIHPDISLVISPGSVNIVKMLSDNGALSKLLAAGARILEPSCGPCIGMGQAPKTNGVSLRTFNRNFKGRCGTESADVYIVSPETAAISAITGEISNPADFDFNEAIAYPEQFDVSESLFIRYNDNKPSVSVEMGPNIKPFPVNTALDDTLDGKIILKVGDNITTDDIMPSNAKLLPYRSNIPHLSNFCFSPIDPDFAGRAVEYKGGFIIGGENYGQGSSREHAALVPLYLGIKTVIAKSFARIHKANLINSGILPLTFINASDYDQLQQLDDFKIENIYQSLDDHAPLIARSKKTGTTVELQFEGTSRDIKILKSGGYINFMKGSD